MPSLSVNSAEIYFQETGSGYPLVLLHGLGSSSDDWLFQTPVFAERWRIIAVNLRGHAPSSLLRGPVTIDTLAADVAQLLDALEIRQAHVLGLSLGGLVGQVLAIDFAEKVNQTGSGQHLRAPVADFTARGLHAGTARGRVEILARAHDGAGGGTRSVSPTRSDAVA